MLSNLFCVIPIFLYPESGDVKTGCYHLLYFPTLSTSPLIKVQIRGAWNFCLPSDCKHTNLSFLWSPCSDCFYPWVKKKIEHFPKKEWILRKHLPIY